MAEVLLIDLSSIAHPIWHTSSTGPDLNVVSQNIAARVRSLASQHPHAAICCDSGRCFRHELSPVYKANRPPADAGLHHQIDRAVEALEQDGFPIWRAPGFEADDVIASAAKLARAAGHDVLIASADKDLLQLVGDGVRAMSVRDGTVYDADGVVAKIGVRPDQVRDWLTIVGDASDNVKGMKGLGEKKAAALLQKFHTLDDLYRDLAEIGPATLGLTPAVATALKEFQPHLATARALVTLRTDVAISFDDLLRDRTPRAVADFEIDEEPEMETSNPETTEQPEAAQDPKPVTALVPREADILAPAPAEWEKQLEPRSMREVQTLSKHLFDSRLFLNAYGTPQAVMSTILAGRELGLQSMASLRAIHIVEGKPTLSADLIRALVIRSGLARYFRCTERADERATFETQRGDDPPIALTFTIEQARRAWAKTQDAWDKSGWGHNPADMLVARAGAKLARLVYPDVVHGVYTREEIEDAREQVA